MEKHKPSANLFLDTRRSKSNGKYPLKLSIYCRPEKRRYGLNIELTEEEWQKINNPKLKNENLKEVRIKSNALLTKSERILEKLSPFSFAGFEYKFYENGVGKTDLSLSSWFTQYIEELDSQGREGTRISYKTTFNSFSKFKANLKLTDITKEFLEKYENHMRHLGKSPSTIGIYLRQLRAIINQAIDKGILKQETYPFNGFQIPSSRNVKKALSDEQLQFLLNYLPQSVSHERALDFWVFSYLCNGMNFTDIAHIKHENISGIFMHFIRQKTIRTRKRDLRPIRVALNSRALSIIEKWKNKNINVQYLFPILETGLTPKTVKHRIRKFIKSVNKAMDEIRQELGIEQKVGTYVARHSFSSRLMRKGVSTQFIKESLGHSSVAVTENYLGDFSDNVKLEYSNLLTEF